MYIKSKLLKKTFQQMLLAEKIDKNTGLLSFPCEGVSEANLKTSYCRNVSKMKNPVMPKFITVDISKIDS